MRRFLMAVMMIGAVQSAQAADMPDLPFLRGSFTEAPLRSTPVWQGYYVGGQASQSWLRIKPARNYNVDIQASYIAQTGITPTSIAYPPGAEGRAAAYGGFVGYNSQWDDVLLGVEANYLHSDVVASSLAYSFPTDPIQGISSVTVAMKDFGSLRMRGGYIVGNFLPYAFVGVGAGSADITRSAGAVSNLGLPIIAPFVSTNTNRFVYGYSAGVGLDVMLLGGLFARVEYEYLQFTNIAIDAKINSVRAGLGYKF